MIYVFDDKKLIENKINSIIIIHNEQKFFAWLLKNLKPECAWFLRQAQCGRGYNDESDEESRGTIIAN